MTSTNGEGLSRSELLKQVAALDAERERIKQLINNNPASMNDNQERKAYVKRLDVQIKRLVEAIGTGQRK